MGKALVALTLLALGCSEGEPRPQFRGLCRLFCHPDTARLELKTFYHEGEPSVRYCDCDPGLSGFGTVPQPHHK